MIRKLRQFLSIALLMKIFCGVQLFAQQQTNTNPALSFINVPTPKTPESAGFEKYGAAQVNEFTGTSSISVPIYTLSSRFLKAPITLAYQATGIRVSQEASWVGLGWDLIAGGRITVETRGTADFCPGTVGLSSPLGLQAGMQKIFNRVGSGTIAGGENAVLTMATFCETGPCSDPSSVDPNFDNLFAIQEMTQFGTGEPDIFRANFMGHSISFYFDKVSNTVKFIGEKSLFLINYTIDGSNNITQWTITDNDGTVYSFNQTETTTNTLTSNPVTPASTTSAWLLTSAVHPTGDYINYIYSNYGYTAPAFAMNGSVSWKKVDINHPLLSAYATPSISTDWDQNVSLQSPYYLTKMETNDVEVNFSLENRSDLYGPGSRRLDFITVVDKQTNLVKKKTSFRYSYFQSNYNPWSAYLNTLNYHLVPPLTTSGYIASSNQRLRLDSIYVNDSGYQPPYRFYYNPLTVDKYNYGQDHWGFYNGVPNHQNGFSFTHLIPAGGFRGVQTQNSIPLNLLPLETLGLNRDCDPENMKAMILNQVVYPTGGISAYTYEPHNSVMVPSVPITGGGIRVKEIKNYLNGDLSGTTSYTYSGGKYMGNIKYFTNADKLSLCPPSEEMPEGGGPFYNYSSGGAMNDNDILLGYATIAISQKGLTGQTNGSVVKTYNVSTSTSFYSNGVGYDLAAPYFTPLENSEYTAPHPYNYYLDPTNKSFPPTPSASLEGKLMQEQYYDDMGSIVKDVKYYYSLANYSNSFYSIRAMENRIGGFLLDCASPNGGWGTGGKRPVMLFVSPAKSFHTLQDSIVEFTYSGSGFLKKKTAYQYNSFYQPIFETVYNSDGTQTINYTRTSAEIHLPASTASGFFATQMFQMYTKHILNLPIEQTVIKRNISGDSTVVSSRFNVYNNTLPLQVYTLETSQPLVFRSQFVPWYYSVPSTYSVIIDSRYKLYSSAEYSADNLVSVLHTRQMDQAFIWDGFRNNLLAECTNALPVDVAYSSFETANTGGWETGSNVIQQDATAPTGEKVCVLDNAGISKHDLNPSKTYIVSYWSSSGNKIINGTAPVVTGSTNNGWVYFEHKIANPVNGIITVTGVGKIDELRLYPKGSMMSTYSYRPLAGLQSKCDVNSRINYYEYDPIDILKNIRDDKKNILKQFDYQYTASSGFLFGNTPVISSAIKNNCGAGYEGVALQNPYKVPGNLYYSSLSQNDADQKAITDAAINGQVWANENGTCIPYFRFSPNNSLWGNVESNFSLPSTGNVDFSFKIHGLNSTGVNSAYGQLGTITSGPLVIPLQPRTVTINTYTVFFYEDGAVHVTGPSFTGTLELTGSYIR